jgi:hypothetical protein
MIEIMSGEGLKHAPGAIICGKINESKEFITQNRNSMCLKYTETMIKVHVMRGTGLKPSSCDWCSYQDANRTPSENESTVLPLHQPVWSPQNQNPSLKPV